MANTPVASAIGHDKYSSLGLNNTNDNNISISTSSGLRLAISRSGTRPEMRPFFRLIILFALGSLLSLLVDSLQQSHRITRWPRASNTDPSGLGTNAVANSFGSSSTGSSSSKSDGSGSSYSSNSGSNPTTSANSGYIALVESAWRGGAGSPFSSAGWVPLSCGLAACLMGTLYPLLDQWLLSKQQAITIRRDWSSALRCCGGFIGVCYAASKLTLSSSLQLSLTLALLAIGIWFLFDRTLHGFIISFTGATIGTIVVLILVRHGVYRPIWRAIVGPMYIVLVVYLRRISRPTALLKEKSTPFF